MFGIAHCAALQSFGSMRAGKRTERLVRTPRRCASLADSLATCARSRTSDSASCFTAAWLPVAALALMSRTCQAPCQSKSGTRQLL